MTPTDVLLLRWVGMISPLLVDGVDVRDVSVALREEIAIDIAGRDGADVDALIERVTDALRLFELAMSKALVRC